MEHDKQIDNSKLSINNSQLIIYQTESGQTKIEVRLENETVWLTQKLMAELFQVAKSTISEHIKHIFEEGELEKPATVRKFRTVQTEGTRNISRELDYFNLDMIISVGYRVQSHVATRFRQWATRHIREYIVKGFVLDDERLKNPDLPFDYFDELLKRIQDIRTSEKRFYQKITDIYTTSVDYDPTLETSITFFKTVQNKLHWAITGQTAAEIIKDRVNSSLPHMGLTNYRGEKVRKEDVIIAKNYLNKKELSALNNLVEQYLVFAEGQAMRRIPMTMQDWINKLDGFLGLNDRDILTHAGNVSHDLAKQIAEQEYNRHNLIRIKQADQSGGDFEKAIKKIPAKKDKK